MSTTDLVNKAWSDVARQAAQEVRRNHQFVQGLRQLQARPKKRPVLRPRSFSMDRLQSAVSELRSALGKVRVAALEDRLNKISDRLLRKAWTDEARAAALEARRARQRLPDYLEQRGYVHTGMAYDDPHRGDWSRSQMFFEHAQAPHKQVVFHSSGDWEIHDTRRQRGRRAPEAAIARGSGVPKLRAAIRQYH